MTHAEKDLIETMKEIESAFAGVSRGGGISLHETRVEDDQGSEEERAEARAKDTDVRWQDVPDEAIEKPDLSLSFLDPTGFRYYLPAYMMWELRLILEGRSVDCNTHGAAVFALILDEENDMREWRLPYYELFTQEQERAICKFLRFYAEHGDEWQPRYAQEALDKYWNQRE